MTTGEYPLLYVFAFFVLVSQPHVQIAVCSRARSVIEVSAVTGDVCVKIVRSYFLYLRIFLLGRSGMVGMVCTFVTLDDALTELGI